MANTSWLRWIISFAATSSTRTDKKTRVRLKGNCTSARVKKPNQPLLVKLAIPMLFPLLPPLSRLATSMRLIRAGLGWKGWSSCLLVEWLPYPRESVERFGAGFNQEQSFQIPCQRASICTGDFFPRGFLPPSWMGSWQIHPLHQGEVVCFHIFLSPHEGYMIHALNAMVPWWLKVTSYTERNHVPERLMDGTYVEGLCAYQARIETTSNL